MRAEIDPSEGMGPLGQTGRLEHGVTKDKNGDRFDRDVGALMQRVDYVIAGLAVLALVGSVLGIIWYDEDEGTLYDVTVTENDNTANVWSTTLTGSGASDDTTWSLNQQNITQIDFIVEISSAPTVRTDDTVVEVEITSPTGQTQIVTLELTGTGADDDDGTMTFTIHSTPSDLSRVSAANRTAAVAMIETGLNGTGAWSLTAETTSGGAQGPLGLQDEDVSVSVRAEYQFYQANARVHVPDISPAG